MSEKIIVSEDEILIQPNFHDAKVRGLLLLSDRRLLIVLGMADGQQRCLMLYGVERLKADDFREGNIILDITVSRSASLDVRDIADAYGVAPTENTFLPKAMDKLKREGFIVVRLDPSYGCSLVCICQDIRIVDEIMLP